MSEPRVVSAVRKHHSMSHELDRITSISLLFAKFGRVCLKLFNERVAGVIVRNRLRSIINDVNLADRVVVDPGANVLRCVWSQRIEADLKQHSFPEAFQRFGNARVVQSDAGTSNSRVPVWSRMAPANSRIACCPFVTE
jgi:hypothetical protein